MTVIGLLYVFCSYTLQKRNSSQWLFSFIINCSLSVNKETHLIVFQHMHTNILHHHLWLNIYTQRWNLRLLFLIIYMDLTCNVHGVFSCIHYFYHESHKDNPRFYKQEVILSFKLKNTAVYIASQGFLIVCKKNRQQKQTAQTKCSIYFFK